MHLAVFRKFNSINNKEQGLWTDHYYYCTAAEKSKCKVHFQILKLNYSTAGVGCLLHNNRRLCVNLYLKSANTLPRSKSACIKMSFIKCTSRINQNRHKLHIIPFRICWVIFQRKISKLFVLWWFAYSRCNRSMTSVSNAVPMGRRELVTLAHMWLISSTCSGDHKDHE